LLLAPKSCCFATSVRVGQPAVRRAAARLFGRRLELRLREPVLLVPCESRAHGAITALGQLPMARPVYVAGSCVDRMCTSVGFRADGSVEVKPNDLPAIGECGCQQSSQPAPSTGLRSYDLQARQTSQKSKPISKAQAPLVQRRRHAEGSRSAKERSPSCGAPGVHRGVVSQLCA